MEETVDVVDEPVVSVEDDGRRGERRWMPTALVVAATLLAVVSATTTWVRAQALDTDAWVDTSTELLAEPAVQEALATYLVDQLYTNADVAGAIESALPDDLGGLAGPVAGALRGPATEGIERLLSGPRFQQAWEVANRRAHEALVAIVRNESRDNLSISNGAVVLDLAGAVRTVGETLGLPDSALDRIPDDVGQVTVFESGELADVQTAVRVLDLLSWFLFVVVIALYALAVYLARARRRETVRNIGVGLVVGGIVLLALRAISVRSAVAAIVDVPANRPLGRLVGDVLTQLLTDMAWTAIIVGVVIILYTFVLGPHRWAVALRTHVAATSHPDAIAVVVGIVVLVGVAWWSPGRIFERWSTTLIALGLIASATVALAAAVRTGSTAESSSFASGDNATVPTPPRSSDERTPHDE